MAVSITATDYPQLLVICCNYFRIPYSNFKPQYLLLFFEKNENGINIYLFIC